MIIRKRPIISWLLNMDNVEEENKFGVPMLTNVQHFGYLSNGLQFLSDVRGTRPEWGLPELLMPSFEKVMAKGAEYGLSEKFVTTLFNAIHDASVQEQNAILGSSSQEGK